jgi:hypothetical protein
MSRVLGEILAISVASSVPIEKLLTTDIVKEYDYIYLNIRTLYRNFHGSFNLNELPDIDVYVEEFIKEINTIRAIINESIPGNKQAVIYHMSCSSLKRIMPRAKLKIPTTAIQKNYETLEKITLIKAFKEINKDSIQFFDTVIKGHNTKAMLLSHFPIDLLSYHSFRKLVLLESHTGVVKTRTEWITKITKNEDYRNIPFNVLSIQILGDRSVQLRPIGLSVSSALLSLAVDNKWNPTTSLEKIKFDIRKLKDRLLSEILLEMCTVSLR